MTTKEQALRQACLIATTGSRAYGLNHANSDLDQMGVFIAPTTEIAGLDWNKYSESWTNTSPDGDDLTLHEVGKYLRLTLKGNPTLVELLFMDEYTKLTNTGKHILRYRDALLSEPAIRSSYFGYAISQLIRVREAKGDFKPKMARHTLRIARQGKELLETGNCTVKVSDPQEYFDLTEMPHPDIVTTLQEAVDAIQSAETILPKEPNRDTIVDLLRQIRKDNI